MARDIPHTVAGEVMTMVHGRKGCSDECTSSDRRGRRGGVECSGVLRSSWGQHLVVLWPSSPSCAGRRCGARTAVSGAAAGPESDQQRGRGSDRRAPPGTRGGGGGWGG